MRVELSLLEPVMEPRLWVKHQPVLAMALGLGSIEAGSLLARRRRHGGAQSSNRGSLHTPYGQPTPKRPLRAGFRRTDYKSVSKANNS
jgi:hypothetical protein